MNTKQKVKPKFNVYDLIWRDNSVYKITSISSSEVSYVMTLVKYEQHNLERKTVKFVDKHYRKLTKIYELLYL